ncbi:MAG: bacteriohemerythrin [Peptococcaceae bacterium]|jgi:hemerythrin|nr:bacteriohemerythrin [Peptococcaceae bacterium]
MNGGSQGIAWSDSYSLENEQIDLQHKKLFELVNGLIKDCMDGHDVENLKETLAFLANYTVRHFHFEEELQQEYAFPDYDRHKQLHEDFKVTVGDLIERFNQIGSSAELSSDVNRIVVRWLVNHILREDKMIGNHIRKMEN